MRIISHRGYWKAAEEMNTDTAFRRAFSSGFGVETDLRDFGSRIVISHDSPSSSAMPFEAFLDLYKDQQSNTTLALNIKADGLQDRVRVALIDRGVTNYFFFDMSAPDALEYKRKDLKFFTRQSELEIQPILYDSAMGIWMDSFFDDWIDRGDILTHLDAGKEVCICSPELHHREPSGFWDRLARWGLSQDRRLMLCTDKPKEAYEFFSKKD
jgi:hypothetical protein